MEKKSLYSVQSVERALLLLETIARCEDGIRIRDLAEQIELNVSTVHRLVSLLEQKGYLEQEMETKRYFLGLKVMELQGLLIHKTRLPDVGAAELKKLVQEVGETAHLAVLHEGDVVYIDSCEGRDSSIGRAAVGRRVPIYCTALGKALVAWHPWETVERYLSSGGMEARTEHTICTIPDYRNELHGVRRHGYALDRMENSLSSCCVAAPIRNHKDEVVAAVSISCPSYRIDEIGDGRFRDPLLKCARQISIRIGYRTERD